MGRANEIDLKDFLKQRKKIPVLSQAYEYVHVKEYAEIIKAHPVTINRWLNNGKIEGAIKVCGRWKIPVSKVRKGEVI